VGNTIIESLNKLLGRRRPVEPFLLAQPLSENFCHVDLGCGSRKASAAVLGHPDRKADIGIDICPDNGAVDIVCPLGLEKIPLKDNSVDLVTAHDFMEHIPRQTVVPNALGHLEYRNPTLYLVNEIHRILKSGGYFEAIVPSLPEYPSGAVRDPTHVSFYSLESFDYFCFGRFEMLARSYGLERPFERVSCKIIRGSHIQALLRKT